MNDSSEEKSGKPERATAPDSNTGKAAKASGKAGPQKPAGRKAADQDTATTKHPPRRTAHGRARGRVRRGGASLLLGILALNAALAVGGFYLWQQQNRATDEARERITRLKEDQQRLSRALDESRRALDDRLRAFQETQQGLRDDLAALLERSGHLRNDWMIAEAEYLIRLANHRLLLDRDVDTALAALATADERLRDTGDPALIPARKALADDMAALRALPRVDRTGLSLQLSALAQRVASLPLATPSPEHMPDSPANPAGDGEAAAAEADTPWWGSLSGAWEILRGLIVIRQHDDPVQPLIPPEQRFFLTHNLVLQLEQARIALLRGEQAIYRERVQQAHTWVARYFDRKDAAVADSLAQLQSLSEQDIAPPLPEITRGLAAIARYRTRQAGTPPAVTAKPAPKPEPKPKPKPAPPAQGSGTPAPTPNNGAPGGGAT